MRVIASWPGFGFGFSESKSAGCAFNQNSFHHSSGSSWNFAIVPHSVMKRAHTASFDLRYGAIPLATDNPAPVRNTTRSLFAILFATSSIVVVVTFDLRA